MEWFLRPDIHPEVHPEQLEEQDQKENWQIKAHLEQWLLNESSDDTLFNYQNQKSFITKLFRDLSPQKVPKPQKDSCI